MRKAVAAPTSNAQIDAGAQAGDGVRLVGRRAGATTAFAPFSLDYTRQVLVERCSASATARVVPRIVFTKGGGLWLRADGPAATAKSLGVD